MLKHALALTGENPTLATYQAALDAIYQGAKRERENASPKGPGAGSGSQAQQAQQRGGGGGGKGVGAGANAWADKAVRIYGAMLQAGVIPDGRAVERVLLALVQVRNVLYVYKYRFLGCRGMEPTHTTHM